MPLFLDLEEKKKQTGKMVEKEIWLNKYINYIIHFLTKKVCSPIVNTILQSVVPKLSRRGQNSLVLTVLLAWGLLHGQDGAPGCSVAFRFWRLCDLWGFRLVLYPPVFLFFNLLLFLFVFLVFLFLGFNDGALR